MKNNKKLLSKFLTIILSTMMIFSSVLVVNTNVVFALEDEETVEEVAPEKEETIEEEKIEETQTITEKTGDEAQPKEGEEPVEKEIDNFDDGLDINGKTTTPTEEETTNTTVKDDINDTQNTIEQPKTMMMVGGIFNNRKTVTFINGSSTYKTEAVAPGATIADPGTPESTRNNGKNDDKFMGWYYRDYTDLLGLFYKEVKADFPFTVNGKITFYAKYASASDFDKIFDFKVNNERGSFTHNGYSYYNYYKKADDSFLMSIIEAITDIVNFNNAVETYEYIMTEDQEEPFEGTAFDIAIQEANEGDTITLLHDMYIVKPIEIWANVNLDLNGKKLVFNEYGINLDVQHKIDTATRKSDIIFAKDICAAIYINNARTNISNGYIINKHKSGKGVLSVCDDLALYTTLTDLDIKVLNPMNAVESGYYAYDDGFNIIGIRPGAVTIESGKYDGYLKNNGDGYLRILGEQITKDNKFVYETSFTKNPLYLSGGINETNVTILDGYQIWEDSSSNYRYAIDIIPEAKATLKNGTEKEYRNLETAIVDIDNSSDGIIHLLKDKSYESEILGLNYNKTYTINTEGNTIERGNTITGGLIEVSAGNVTFTGNGQVKSAILCVGGTVVIADGHYSNISANGGTLKVTGGYFKEDVTDYVDTGYVCIYSDMPDYPFCVVAIDEKGQIQFWNNDVRVADPDNAGHYLDERLDYKLLKSAINAINNGSVDATTIKLNRETILNDVIVVKQPLTIDLNGNNLYSNVKVAESVPIGKRTVKIDASIIVNTSGSVSFINSGNKAALINATEASANDTVYGMYILNGDVSVNGFNITMQPTGCMEIYGIYNDSYNDTNYELVNTLSISGAAITTSETDCKATGIYNLGNLNLGDKASVVVETSSKSTEAKGVVNDGTLNVNPVGRIQVSASGGNITSAYGIYSSGDVNVNGGWITVNNKNGNCWGIYEDTSNEDNKLIKIENGGYINVSRTNNSEGAVAYGIYTEIPSYDSKYKTFDGTANIVLGKCAIVVDTLNLGYGIYSNGGKVTAGTIDGVAFNGVFNTKNASGTTFNIPDPISTNNLAAIKMQGGDNSVGIYCGYKEADDVVSQLSNTYISMQKDHSTLMGKNEYCISSNTSSTAVEVLGGYYRSEGTTDLVTSNVKLKGGYYTRNETSHLANNYKCKLLNPAFTADAFSIITIPVFANQNTFDYLVEGSDCKLSVTVENRDKLVVKAVIQYDPYMLTAENRSKYGVRFDVACLSAPIMTTIEQSINSKKISEDQIDENTQFTYTFEVPAKNMVDNIAVYIVDFKEGESTLKVNHAYHMKTIYSVKDYYYNMLLPENKHSNEVRDLAAASLNYGAYAQAYFKYKTDQLVNEQLGTFYNANGVNYSTDVGYDESIKNLLYPINDSETKPFDKEGYSLSLEGATILRYSFSLLSTDDIGDFKFYCNGKELSCNYDKTSKLYYVDIDGIATAELNKGYDIEVKKDAGTANEQSYVICYSPIDYIYKAVTTTGGDADLVKLMNALYQYYLIAKNFEVTED